ncbi:DUF6792 domain-containing protein [Halalkalibacter hemicellulosilyticus]|uniref:DUF6792 domain-containing protein n=1 Tax=Halalkalibacter hemicellulosilyticusJCM 9152 TaxID=1236971 RepID=W4QCN3_9BACI|nr:DUF6792 domain-containing protein [Halalkalibacter hemicellulosilyticus]GAE29408.1 hypothetical protein JCM9152_765 [Halalkalibacter hemicellulosilyticusJCM 9152]
MNAQKVLDSDLLRARIVSMEYDEVTESEVRRLILEETGKETPENITIYHSNDIDAIHNSEVYSGFDGTVIHIYDEVQGINQMYTIVRGSEGTEKDSWKPKDWIYNGMAIGAGQSSAQYLDTLTFQSEVSELIRQRTPNNISLESYGIAHSLGGNNTMNAQLTDGIFDKLYVFNPAPPSVFHLAYLDRDFRIRIMSSFGIEHDFSQLRSIPPDELVAFGEEYYKSRIDESSIQRLVIKEEMLFGLLQMPGFMDIGEGEVISTIDGHDGIQKVAAAIPDEVIFAFQEYLSEYAEVYNQEGFDGFFREMTGIRPGLMDAISDLREIRSRETPYTLQTFVDTVGASARYSYHLILSLKPTIERLKETIPQVLSLVRTLRTHLLDIVEVMVEQQVITFEQGQELVEAVESLEAELNGMHSDVNKMLTLYQTNVMFVPIGVLLDDFLFEFETFGKRLEKVNKDWTTIQTYTSTIVDYFHVSAEAHKMDHIIDYLGKKSGSDIYKVYDPESNDMIYVHDGLTSEALLDKLANVNLFGAVGGTSRTNRSGGQEVYVNISSAIRIFRKGKEVCANLLMELSRMQQAYERDVLGDDERRKQRLRQQIHQMEQNPNVYQRQFFGQTTQVYSIRRISVQEFIPALPQTITDSFEEFFYHYRKDLRQTTILIEEMRVAIETLFEHDEHISNIFKYA